MTFQSAMSKICPIMSARYNSVNLSYENKPVFVNCVCDRCMAFTVTKTHESLPSGSALYDIEGDELPYNQKEGYCNYFQGFV